MQKKALKFFELSNEELLSKLGDLKAELFNLRFKHTTKLLNNPLVMVECKRNIARVKTVLRQRELGIAIEPSTAAEKKKAKKHGRK